MKNIYNQGLYPWDAVSGCKFDMLFKQGNNYFFVETKNYAKSSLSNITSSSSFYNQLKTYLKKRDLTNLDNLFYFFRSNPGVKREDIVEKFKTLLTNKAEDLFNNLGQDKMQQLFGMDNLSDFLDEIDDISSPIYNFIKVK